MASYDIIGNVAIIKSEENNRLKTKKQKLKQAEKLLENKNIKTVLERVGNVSGRLRTIKVKHIKGKKNLIAEYKENN